MDVEQRIRYTEYIAAAIRFAEAETGLRWPDETIIVAKSYCPLVGLDKIIGIPIFIMDMPSAVDFSVAFPAGYEGRAGLQKAFEEYQSLYNVLHG